MTTTLVLAVAAAALPTGGAPAQAGAQHLSPARTAPVTIPGTGLRKGEALPRGARLLYRDVTVAGDAQPRFAFTAPRGTTIRGLAPAESRSVGFAVVDRGDYVGRRTVRVRVYLAPRATQGAGRIYALVREGGRDRRPTAR